MDILRVDTSFGNGKNIFLTQQLILSSCLILSSYILSGFLAISTRRVVKRSLDCAAVTGTYCCSVFFCGKQVLFHLGASMQNGTKPKKILFALNVMVVS